MLGTHIYIPAERRTMGEKNNVLNVYMNKPERIQSVLEYYLKEKSLTDGILSWEDASGFYSVTNGRKVSFRQRDIFKKVSIKGGAFFLGIENQEDRNLIFPWRIMQMDCLEYEKQIEEIRQTNREKEVVYNSEDDFLYNFRNQDRLIPCINLVLYWGKRKWKKPLKIMDMVDISDFPSNIRNLFQDYKVHLIHMRYIPDSSLNEMKSDLKYVLGLLKCAGNKKKCREYIMDNRQFFSAVPKSAMDVLNVYMNMRYITQSEKYFKEEKGEEYVDMCKALEDWKKESIREGRNQGKKESQLKDIQNLMKNLQITAKQAMKLLEISPKEQKEYLQIIG